MGEGSPEVNFDSQWNMASAYFFRIHTAFVYSNYYGAKGDYSNKYQHLFNIHLELSGQMKPDELKICQKLDEESRVALFNRGNVLVLKQALYNYEIFLRQVMKLRRMDLPRNKDPSRAIIGGNPE